MGGRRWRAVVWPLVVALTLRGPPPASGLQTGWQHLRSFRAWEFASRFCFRTGGGDGEEDSSAAAPSGAFDFTVKYRPEDQVVTRDGGVTRGVATTFKPAALSFNVHCDRLVG